MLSILDITALFGFSIICLFLSFTKINKNILIYFNVLFSCLIVSYRTIGVDTKVYTKIFEHSSFSSALSIFTDEVNDFEFIWNILIFLLKTLGLSVHVFFFVALFLSITLLLAAYKKIFVRGNTNLFIFCFWLVMYFQLINIVRGSTAAAFAPLILFFIFKSKLLSYLLTVIGSISFHRSMLVWGAFSFTYLMLRKKSYFILFTSITIIVIFLFILNNIFDFFSYTNITLQLERSFMKFNRYFMSDYGAEFEGKPLAFNLIYTLLSLFMIVTALSVTFINFFYTQNEFIKKSIPYVSIFIILSLLVLLFGKVSMSIRLTSLASGFLVLFIYDFFTNSDIPDSIKMYMTIVQLWLFFLHFLFYSEIGYAF